MNINKKVQSILITTICAVFALSHTSSAQNASAQFAPKDESEAQLAQEIAHLGWIAYSARSHNGSWDIFVCRPDGSDQRQLTDTPEFEEAAPVFLQDGQKMVYRRMKRGTVLDHDLWGFEGQLVTADANGQNARALGRDKEYTWASCSDDITQMACLTRGGIQFVDPQTGLVTRTMQRKGIFQQLFLSKDGKWFTGTANHAGSQWCVVRMNAETGEVNPIITFQSCTPDWFPDSQRVIFSSRPKQKSNRGYGWTILCMANGDGSGLQLIYGEEGYHIYGGTVSPDSQYVLFTKSARDGGESEKAGAPICVMRLSDAPTIKGKSAELREMYPNSKDGTVLTFAHGWEPSWTYRDIFTGE